MRNVSVLVAIGVGLDGHRAILGVAEGAKEGRSGWAEFLKHLKERGLTGVKLIISDACVGLVDSLAEHYPQACWQRCAMHFYRNVLSQVPRAKMRAVATMVKVIHAADDRSAALTASRVVEKLKEMKLPKAASLIERAVPDTLAYYAFPDTHWRSLRTNNPMERLMREIRRRTRVVGAFPDGQSALMLVAARLRHIATTHWGTRRYLAMEAAAVKEVVASI